MEASVRQDSWAAQPASLPAFSVPTSAVESGPVNSPADLFSNYYMEDDCYVTREGQRVLFSAGKYTDPETQAAAEKRRMENELDQINYVHRIFGKTDLSPSELNLDEHEDNRWEDMGNDPDEMLFEEIRAGGCGDGNGDWFPYESKTMFLLDYMDSLPRMRLSDDHLKIILWIMRESGAPNVPSFSSLRSLQKKLLTHIGIKPTHHESSLGNHFYMNHPKELISLDWGNPHMRPLMHLYPEVEGPVQESWQAEKWVKEANINEDSPMWANWDDISKSHRQYFVHELAQMRDGGYILILRWVTVKGVMSAQVKNVIYVDELDMFQLMTEEAHYIPATELEYNIFDIMKSIPEVKLANHSPEFTMPSPLRTTGNGKPMFRIRLMPWSDDVSGNLSKQYNAHTNTCVLNLNIPHRISGQEYFVRFCSTSQTASSSEQFVALAEDFNSGVWNEAYDCQLETDILFQIVPHILPGDNPQQSETSSHIGVKGNFNSRRDTIGGSEKEKEEEMVYLKLHETGSLRTVEQTVEVIKWQVRKACTGNQKVLHDRYSQTGVKDKISQYWIAQLVSRAREMKDARVKQQNIKNKAERERIEREIEEELWTWVTHQPKLLDADNLARDELRPGDHYNVLLGIRGLNVHQDTPIEILHTYLLGNDKYVWFETWNKWPNKEYEETFANRLQSASVDGLSIMAPRAHYMVQYKNNLIGKHFRVLQQLAVFQLHNITSEKVLNIWKATGELGALIWYPEISNMDEYLSDLQVLIDNLLDAWGQFDPRRIISKVKLRLLPYLVDDVRRFGPAIFFATELFESYNHIFRLCSVYSNHHAPSHDIAVDLAGMERFKHIISGGWWKMEDGGRVQAGKEIRRLFGEDTEIRRRLGWKMLPELACGTIKSPPEATAQRISGADICKKIALQSRYVQLINGIDWNICEEVVAHSKDPCKPNSWIFFEDQEGKPAIGRVHYIIRSDSTMANAWVVLKAYDVDTTRDARLNMPVLIPSQGGFVLAKPENINFLFNAQHDCYLANCRLSQSTEEFYRQERIRTSKAKTIVVHSQLDRYLINMHALHNAHLLRQALPASLTKPVPFHKKRDDVRRELAVNLGISGKAKRAATKAKASETRKLKQSLKAAQAQGEASRETQSEMTDRAN